MPVLVLAGLVVSGANVLADRLPSLDDPTGEIMVTLIVGVAITILLAPVQIGVFRFIIRDEVTRHYALNLNTMRFRRFCAWSVGYWLLIALLSRIPSGLGLEDDAKKLCEIAMLSVTFAIGVSITLIFPAIAADAPGATLRNALADLRGSFWRAFAILMLVVLPVLAVLVLATWRALERTDKIEGDNVIAVLGWLGFLLSELLSVAAAARMFQALAARLRAPAS